MNVFELAVSPFSVGLLYDVTDIDPNSTFLYVHVQCTVYVCVCVCVCVCVYANMNVAIKILNQAQQVFIVLFVRMWIQVC